MAGAPSLVHPSLSYTLRAQGYHTPYTEVDPGVENAINKLKGLTGQKPLLRAIQLLLLPLPWPWSSSCAPNSEDRNIDHPGA